MLEKNSSIEETRKEIETMSKCYHENVMSYFVSFVTDKELWLVMPLLGAGSLKDVLKSQSPKGLKDESLIASILKQIVSGLQYFHSKNHIHRDIKCDNILMHTNGRIFLGDFGVSDSIKRGQKKEEFVGSPCWMAPEVIQQSEGYDTSADIWSLGITAIELTENNVPYQDLPAMKTMMLVLNQPSPSISKYSNWSPEFRAMVDHCL